jgi:hypothetical protein
MKKTTKNKSVITRAKHKQWTKEELARLMKIWDKSTLEQVCDELGRNKAQIHAMAKLLRQNGLSLPRKRVLGYTQHLVREFVSEFKRSY